MTTLENMDHLVNAAIASVKAALAEAAASRPREADRSTGNRNTAQRDVALTREQLTALHRQLVGDRWMNVAEAQAERSSGLEMPRLAEAGPIVVRHERAIRQAYRVEHQLYQVENATIAEIKRELETARRSTIALLSTASKDWQIAQAQALLEEIKRQLAAWSATAAANATGRLTEVADLGTEQCLASLGMRLSGPMISRDFVVVAYQTLPLLVADVSAEATRKIGTILRQAVLAQQTPLDAMHAIGALSGKGVFHSAFERGETIIRTEYGRIAQTASYRTLVDLAKESPDQGLQKEWSAVADVRTRASHAAANGQIVNADASFSIGGHAALYPHDPRLPARESIACRCISVPYSKAWT